jgi:hypothetical protein
MSIADKLVTIAENEQRVYEAGQASMVDESKLLPTTVTGDGFVHLDDVSEVPHDITIQAAEGTKVTVVRNNLFDVNNVTFKKNDYAPKVRWYERLDNGLLVCDTSGGWVSQRAFIIEDIEAYKGVTLKTAVKINPDNTNSTGTVICYTYDENGNNGVQIGQQLIGSRYKEQELTIPMDTTSKKFGILLYSSAGGSAGNNKVAYTDFYIAKKEEVAEYVVGANGIINGIKSADNLTIIADNEITVTYNKSWGKYIQHKQFWDTYLEQFKWRPHWAYAFYGLQWDDRTFKPNQDFKPTGSCERAFSAWEIKDNLMLDLTKMCEKLNIAVDTSLSNNINYLFYYNNCLYRVPTVNATGCTSEANMRGVFGYAYDLQIIDKVIVNNATTYTDWFVRCDALREVRFEGTIAKGGMNLQHSTKLSRASIESVINALSSTTSGLAITFSKTAANSAFTTEEWNALAATKSNWTISLV